MLIIKLYILILALLWGGACAEDKELPPIEGSLSTAVAMRAHPSKSLFYVLNSDASRNYASGSILTLSAAGEKIASIQTPRVGVSMAIRDSFLLAIFDREADDDASATLQLFDISTAEQPSFVKEWDLGTECKPINVTARDDYKYFVLSCLNGDVHVGTITADPKASTLRHVRTYPGYARRAVYIDPKRELAFFFVTDFGVPQVHDRIANDKYTFKIPGDISTRSEQSNDSPDFVEESRQIAGAVRTSSSAYQFMVYDFRAEAEADFPQRDYIDIVDTEARWLYFNLFNHDGAPDDVDTSNDETLKYYRTNFWTTRPDPVDPDVFYLSHRGLVLNSKSPHANSIVRVNISGDPRDAAQLTEQYLSFDRVFGFKGQVSDKSYFSDFEVVMVQGQKTVVVNSFRDLVNFENPEYRLAAAALNNLESFPWAPTQSSGDVGAAFYGVAISQEGKLLTSLFYSNSLQIYELKLGSGLKLLKTIN